MEIKNIYNKIFRSTFKYLILKNFTSSLTIIVNILIVRILSPSQYGKWALVWLITSNTAPLLSLGFLSTLSKFLPGYPDEKKKNELFSKTILIVLTLICVVSLIYEFGHNSFIQFLPHEIREINYSLIALIGAISLINLFEGYYRGLGVFNFWTMIDGLRSIGAGGLAILFCLFYSRTYQNVFHGYLIVIFTFLAILFFLNRNKLRIQNLKLDAKLLKFTTHIFLGQILFMLWMTVDPVLIRSLLKDPSQVAYYDLGIKLPMLLSTLILGPLSVPFIYYFSKPEDEFNRSKIIIFGTRIISTIFAIISISFFSFSELIIPLLFTEKYSSSIRILQIYTFVPFLASVQSLGSYFMISMNKPAVLNILSVLGFIITFLLDLLLIPHFKIIGATIANTCGALFITFGTIYFLSTYEIYLIKIFLKLASGILLAILLEKLLFPYSALLFFLIYVWVTHLISKEDIIKMIKLSKKYKS